MAHIRRIGPETTNVQTLVHSRELNARLADRRLGGMVVVDYLFELFAASPFEFFSRLNVLSLLDQVKKDKALFPDRVGIPANTRSPRKTNGLPR